MDEGGQITPKEHVSNSDQPGEPYRTDKVMRPGYKH
jgi:hypothetical protein